MNALTKLKNTLFTLSKEEQELDKKVRDFISEKRLDGDVLQRMPVERELELKAVQDEIDALIERRDALREIIVDEVGGEKAEGLYFHGIPVKGGITEGLDCKKIQKEAPATWKKLHSKYGKDRTRSGYYQFRKRKGVSGLSK